MRHRLGWEPEDNNLVYSSRNFENHDSSEMPNARENHKLEVEKFHLVTREKNTTKHEAKDEIKFDGDGTEPQESNKADVDTNELKKNYSGCEDVPAKFKANHFS